MIKSVRGACNSIYFLERTKESRCLEPRVAKAYPEVTDIKPQFTEERGPFVGAKGESSDCNCPKYLFEQQKNIQRSRMHY